MKRTGVAWLFCLMLLILLPVACATTQNAPPTPEEVYQSALLLGVVTNEAAIDSYSAIRHAWNAKRVDDESMEKAGQAFRTFNLSMSAYKVVLAEFRAGLKTAEELAAESEKIKDDAAEIKTQAKGLGVAVNE